jgi:hypothetical protein
VVQENRLQTVVVAAEETQAEAIPVVAEVTPTKVTLAAEAVTLAAAEATQEKVADRRNNLRVLS